MRLSEKQIGFVRIDLERGDKPARAIIDQLITFLDEPKIAVGRARAGSVALVFRAESVYDVPHIVGADHYQRVFKLASRDGSVRIVIDCDTLNRPLDMSAYSWSSAIDYETLPSMPSVAVLTEKIINGAFAQNLTWAEVVDHDLAVAKRVENFKADLAAGRVSLKTEDDLQAERDAELVKANEGRELSQWDGIGAQTIIGARTRHAARLAKLESERVAELQAVEDRKLLARVERGELPDYLQRVEDARRRQAARQGAAA